MKVIDDIDQFNKLDFAVVTIGTFDGVHLGHQEILNRVVEDARKSKGQSVLITFWPHPRFILNQDASKLKLLTTFDEKVALLEELQLDYLVKVPFTAKFSNLSALDFVGSFLVEKIGTKKLYIGYDHRFGNNRQGDIHFLKEHEAQFDYKVFEILKQEVDDVGISSTKIRNYLHEGNIHLANALLGRRYSITGEVVEGQKFGRELGFPTANIKIPEGYKLLPDDGAYAIHALIGGNSHKGMLNIGFKPTINGSERSIEAHLFNFDENIYGREITIEFVESLRKEKKFNSLDDLKLQLSKDKEEAIRILE